MTPGAGVLVPGRGHISHKVKMHYFFISTLGHGSFNANPGAVPYKSYKEMQCFFSSSLIPGIDQAN